VFCFWIIVPGVLVPGVRVLDVAIDTSGGFRLSRLPLGLFATNRVGSECEEMSSETSSTISDDSLDHQSLLPSLDLSSRYSNLSRVLNPEHANESLDHAQGGLFRLPRESVIFFILSIHRFLQILLPVT